MSTNQTDSESRTDNLEGDVSYLLLVLQVSLLALLIFMVVGWANLTLNAFLDPERVVTEFVWALPGVFEWRQPFADQLPVPVAVHYPRPHREPQTDSPVWSNCAKTHQSRYREDTVSTALMKERTDSGRRTRAVTSDHSEMPPDRRRSVAGRPPAVERNQKMNRESTSAEISARSTAASEYCRNCPAVRSSPPRRTR